jgi:hypothetical protein
MLCPIVFTIRSTIKKMLIHWDSLSFPFSVVFLLFSLLFFHSSFLFWQLHSTIQCYNPTVETTGDVTLVNALIPGASSVVQSIVQVVTAQTHASGAVAAIAAGTQSNLATLLAQDEQNIVKTITTLTTLASTCQTLTTVVTEINNYVVLLNSFQSKIDVLSM